RAHRRVRPVRGRCDGVDGRAPLLHGGGRSGPPARPQPGGAPPARLHGRGDHRLEARLPGPFPRRWPGRRPARGAGARARGAQSGARGGAPGRLRRRFATRRAPVSRERIGLIAGSGRFPVLFAETARRRGVEVFAVAHRGETDPELEQAVAGISWIYPGELAAMIDALKRAGVRRTVMVGGIAKPRLFREFRPDARALAVIARVGKLRDDLVLRAVASELESEGIAVVESTLYLQEIVPRAGVLGARPWWVWGTWAASTPRSTRPTGMRSWSGWSTWIPGGHAKSRPRSGCGRSPITARSRGGSTVRASRFRPSTTSRWRATSSPRASTCWSRSRSPPRSRRRRRWSSSPCAASACSRSATSSASTRRCSRSRGWSLSRASSSATGWRP